MAQLSRDLKIGDRVPVPADADLAMLPYMMSNRRKVPSGQILRPGQRAAATIASDALAAQQRAADPVEQAKTFLRRKGYAPVISDGKGFRVASMRLESRAALFALAKSKGWTE